MAILRHEIRQGLALLQPLVILGGSGKLNVASGVQRRLDRILDDTNDKADTNDLHRNVIGDAEQRTGHRDQQQRTARNAGGTARAQCRHDGQQDGGGQRDGLVFGTPGSGKSMSCKREITFIMLMTQDNVIICDPEDEYSPLVKRLGGQVIRLSPSSTDYVNPLDINLNYSEEENPLALKSDFVLSFCELIMGSKTGLEAIEKTVIDRAVQMIYQPYFADPRPENMPILGDLMEALLAQGIPEADRVAQALDLYVNGSLNFFNHRTTVDIRNRLVCFDIKGLGKNLKKPGMLIVQDAVWNTVTINRAIGRSTWYFVDEFHLLLKEEQTAAYSAEIWKRFRKWGGVPTGATQNPKDLLSSPEIENILENSDFIYMLNQAAGDRKILAERLGISAEQLAYVTNSEPGHGLLFFNNVILPFADDFPKDTELYKLLTTKPSEVEHAAETEA